MSLAEEAEPIANWLTGPVSLDVELDSSSVAVVPGLGKLEPPPSTPLFTDGVFSESLHSSSSPEKIKKFKL